MSIFKTMISYLLNKIWFIKNFIISLGSARNVIAKTRETFREQGIKGVIKKTKELFMNTYLNQQPRSIAQTYQKWLKLYSVQTAETTKEMRKRQMDFQNKPLISIIMPVHNTPKKYLTAAIESVRNQIYENWELCIADDASTHQNTLQTLKNYQGIDPRIKVCFRKKNGHISEASNNALELASGEWIALLDHDDLLTMDALYWVAIAINLKPNAKLIYSDEDKINNSGKRFDPYFKSDWNYSLFLSQNLICHLGVYKAEIVKQIGGFRKGYEGAQDYDLALRFMEEIQENEIYHIPRVLYHWRAHSKSTSKAASNKPYALTAGQSALSEHLKRRNIKASVEILPNNHYKINYQLPQKLPLISLIIPSKNNGKILKTCLDSVLWKTKYAPFEIIVVDNGSDEIETLNYLKSLEGNNQVKIIRDNRPFNFSAINNHAVSFTQGEYICFLNDDTEFINENWLSEMMAQMLQSKVAIVGAKLWYPDHRLQHAGVILGLGGVAGHSHKYFNKGQSDYFSRTQLTQELSAVTGACMLVRKNLFLQVGGFDEENLAISFNDIDLCLKIKALGYKIIWTPFAELYHFESISRGNDMHPDKLERFMKENQFMLQKWNGLLQNDPAYSPNLTLEHEDFTLAWPPRNNEI